jgi:general L-amino acid transport system permease protein
MEQHLDTAASLEVKPPVIHVGVIGWIRANLFNSTFNTLLTLLILFGLIKLVPPLCKWALVDSVWLSSGQVCKESSGACWSVVTQNLRFILFGFYPYEEQWRPVVAILLFTALAFFSHNRRYWNKTLFYVWIVGIVVMGIIMRGGIFGLTGVESSNWSGIILTLMLSLFGLTAAYPLGVLLALGRRSTLPAIKTLSVVYIELIRGVPLISLLFMSSVMFPLFLPEGVTIDKILRAQVAIIMFTAAYIAEVVRGGLQAIPQGQYEAAESLGLNYAQKMRLVVLPQALKIVIPPTVSILISAFKDTSLVIIIGLFDLMKTTKVALSNPDWMGFSTEAYIFIALLYFGGCFSMSNFSRSLEKELKT